MKLAKMRWNAKGLAQNIEANLEVTNRIGTWGIWMKANFSDGWGINRVQLWRGLICNDITYH